MRIRKWTVKTIARTFEKYDDFAEAAQRVETLRELDVKGIDIGELHNPSTWTVSYAI